MHKIIDSGEMVVSGYGKIKLIFDDAVVCKVDVRFKDKNDHIFSCNPHVYDVVEAIITENYDLELIFSVTDIRTIVWEAFALEL